MITKIRRICYKNLTSLKTYANVIPAKACLPVGGRESSQKGSIIYWIPEALPTGRQVRDDEDLEFRFSPGTALQ